MGVLGSLWLLLLRNSLPVQSCISFASATFSVKQTLRVAPAGWKCPPLTCTALAQCSGQVWNYALANKWHPTHSNTLRQRENGRHFPDDNFKCIFMDGNVKISIKMSLKFVPKAPINNIPALVQIMAWCHPGGGLILQWRQYECDDISNHQRYDCILNRLFTYRSKETSRLHVTGLGVGNSPVFPEFPAHRASNTENVSIWWCHQDWLLYQMHV